ncbi:AraC-like DNA-binding protein [Tenacibaculum lutimaris]|uniref:AraC-like DNA-binding protein n=1 Tax=Tenacibaculum lutimaris TaxID=285258 RepID=A0A420DZ47_9FLAO|nr:AraC-like DNA-binding protein [Tenacibaculum lutimaris]
MAFLFVLSVFAENERDSFNKRFDSIYNNTVLQIVSSNLDRAEIIADSLYENSKNKIQKTKALMLKASVLGMQNKRLEAINYALRASKMADSESNQMWISITNRFLSKQYRLIGLTDCSEEYLKTAEKEALKVEDKTEADVCLGMLYQEKAYHNFAKKQFYKTIEFLKKSNNFFLQVEVDQPKNYFVGSNYVMIGRSFEQLIKYDSAQHYFNNSLKLLSKAGLKNSKHQGFVHHGKALIFLEEENYEAAKSELDKAKKIAESDNHKELIEVVYRDLSRFYKEVGSFNNYSLYHEKYLYIKDNNVKASKIAANAEVNRILKEQETSFSLLYWLVAGIVVLLFFSASLFFLQKKKFKKEQQLFNDFLLKDKSKIEEEKLISSNYKKQSKENGEDKKRNETRLMSIETENIILNKLKEFENQNEFIDHDLTLTKLSAKFNVNVKYLSSVINEHKKKDFNNYINQLRIHYIIEKIKTDPDYINYKISYLSVVGGFSSHSKFTSIFKKETGLTPSLFINQIKSRENKE